MKRRGVGRTGSNRVNRGGSWNSNARNVRAANRNWNSPGNRNSNLGFRLARAHAWTGGSALDQTDIATGPGRTRGKYPSRASRGADSG
ncbi:MAG: SUMF1/EgtB/PvdO family nonheme iron enzyme, partial [Myxococcales bacterium]|nr:SUMF1/EgtB/PvdO family nonheme iron enzyme [Myxococcales bacterium]